MNDSGSAKKWERYEQCAVHVLNCLLNELGLDRVESKQLMTRASGTSWELDAKGVVTGSTAFVVIECRCTKRRQSQAKVGSLAFTIQDTGAARGLIVTPVPLQVGAQIVASKNRIQHVLMDIDSTPADFFVKFLDILFVGVTSTAVATAEVTSTVLRTCQFCGIQMLSAENETTCPSCNTAGRKGTQ